jgi:hypothetical protein
VHNLKSRLLKLLNMINANARNATFVTVEKSKCKKVYIKFFIHFTLDTSIWIWKFWYDTNKINLAFWERFKVKYNTFYCKGDCFCDGYILARRHCNIIMFLLTSITDRFFKKGVFRGRVDFYKVSFYWFAFILQEIKQFHKYIFMY